MKPGRELDALVAERVMGLKNVTCRYSESVSEWIVTYPVPSGPGTRQQNVPLYSTNISAAWEVANSLAPEFIIYIRFNHTKGKDWQPGCSSYSNNVCKVTLLHFKNKKTFEGIASDFPHTLCLAALKACGVEVA